MANFDEAIQCVLKNEGGFVDDPDDPGGATNFGLSIRFLHTLKTFRNITEDQLKNMSKDEAISIYKSELWDRYQYDRITPDPIATKLFDISVDIGQANAVKVIQKACNEINKNTIYQDGVLGPMTVNTVNESDQDLLMKQFKAFCLRYYYKITVINPKLLKYLTGWERRALA